MTRKIAFLLLVAATLAAPAGAQNTAEEVVTIPTREDVTVQFILLGPRTGDPPAVILFTGGGGKLGLAKWDSKGTVRKNPRRNFLVRSRKLFANNGLLVAVPDAPSDLIESDLDDFRTDEGHARDIRAVIRHLRRFTKGPVFLVGFGRGSISAAGIAGQARPGELGGIVLTSTITSLSGRRGSVFDAELDNIRVPVLIASHVEDLCGSSPFEDSPWLKSKLTAAPLVEIKGFRGGGYRGRECGARHAHGFRRIEGQVVDFIAAWIKRQAASAPKP